MTHHSVYFSFQILIELVSRLFQLLRSCYLSVNTTLYFDEVSWYHVGDIISAVTEECRMCIDIVVFYGINDACLLLYIFLILLATKINYCKCFKHLKILCLWYMYGLNYVESTVEHLNYSYLTKMSWVVY